METSSPEQILSEVFGKYALDLAILNRYKETHRYYHNIDHIYYMLRIASEYGLISDDLVLAIAFHDIICDPQRSDNEERSAGLCDVALKHSSLDVKRISTIADAILDTKTHEHYSSELSKILCDLDLHNLYGSYSVYYDSLYRIFKEYQYLDFKSFIEGRTKILKKYGVNEERIEMLQTFKPKIGVFAGSFNPFHKGHYNILLKAERIFDKVIIARGINAQKVDMIIDNSITSVSVPITSRLPHIIMNRQIATYNGLLTDFINNLGYDVTLIRGLRNATDLQYESTQYQYLKDMKPDINMVNIFCDKEYEHISSSAIKSLSKYDSRLVNKYLP